MLVLFAAVFAFGGASQAVAQTVTVRGNVGATFFRSPDATKRILHSGSGLGIETSLRVTRGLSLTLEGTYSGFSLNEENARLYSQDGGDVSVLGGALGLRYTLVNSTDAHPYLALGGGIYRLRNTNRKQVTGNDTLAPTNESSQSIEEGLHLGLGSSFRIDETYAIFVEPRYVFYDVSQGIGGTVRYFTLRLGMDVTI